MHAYIFIHTSIHAYHRSIDRVIDTESGYKFTKYVIDEAVLND